MLGHAVLGWGFFLVEDWAFLSSLCIDLTVNSPVILRNFNNFGASEHIANKERKKINACGVRY